MELTAASFYVVTKLRCMNRRRSPQQKCFYAESALIMTLLWPADPSGLDCSEVRFSKLLTLMVKLRTSRRRYSGVWFDLVRRSILTQP